MLLVMDARRIEVETGNGMGRVLPDARVQDVLNDSVVPRFRDDDYAGGVLEGVRILTDDIAFSSNRTAPIKPQARATTKPRVVARNTLIARPTDSGAPVGSMGSAPPYHLGFSGTQSSSPQGNSTPVLLFFLAALGLPILGFAMWKASERRCPKCNGVMRKLDETQDDAALASDQQFEERLGGVDYRVWRCEACNTQDIDRAKRWLSSYSDCPRCGHCTLDSQTRVIQAATYDHTGLEERTRTCQFPNCGFQNVDTNTLPRISRPTTSSSSIHSSHSSTHNSSGSSSSSSSGSDFGGGSSSGGGAGASW